MKKLNCEPQVYKLVEVVRTYLKREPYVLVEIGARDCKETVAFSKLFPQTQIHAYECDPITIPQCRERIKGHKNVTLHETAVSNTIGTIEFNVMPEDPGSSSIFIHKEMAQEKVVVPSTTLEHEYGKSFTKYPDVIWLDTQGAELKILKGAGWVLDEVSIILSEVYFKAAYDGQPLYKDIKHYLNSRGFDLLTFPGTGRNFTDAIFINRKVYKRLTPQWTSELKECLIERITGHTRGLILKASKLLKS